MDESVLMTRTLSLLGYIHAMFQDHGNKPLSARAQVIKDFITNEMSQGNPYDMNDPDKGYPHQYFLTETVGPEVLHIDNLADLHHAVTSGRFSGETNETRVTWTNRELTDELRMEHGSGPDFNSSNW